MNNTFLTESKDKKIEFDYFEIEKIDSEHVFLVNISTTFSDYIDVKVSKSKKILLLRLKAPIQRVNSSTQMVNTTMEFELPGYVETEGYYLNKTGTNIFLIFHKKKKYTLNENSLFGRYFVDTCKRKCFCK